MLERLNFLVVYVGSAALVAFLAVCLTSPEVTTFRCHTAGANGAERCELAATVASFAAVAGEMNPDDLISEMEVQEAHSREPAITAAAQ